MTTAIQQQPSMDGSTLLRVVAGGDVSSLSADQQLAYYNARCDAAGLDPRAQPFAFVKLNGKTVLYALKSASDQLAAKHGVRLEIVSQVTEDGIRVVTVRAIAKDGRQTDEIGAVATKGLVGDALCNALMKAVTKAKRRAVLSLTGLGMLDETEIESIPNAAPAERPPAPVVEIRPAPAKAEKPAEHVPPQANRDALAMLWKRCISMFGESAKAEIESAAARALGEPRPSSTWTDADLKAVEAEIVKLDDVRF